MTLTVMPDTWKLRQKFVVADAAQQTLLEPLYNEHNCNEYAMQQIKNLNFNTHTNTYTTFSDCAF